MLETKTDIEILVLKVEMEQAFAKLKQQLQMLDAEILRRVKEEKEKVDNGQ